MVETFCKEVGSAGEYRRVLRHASELGFEVAKVTAAGAWQSSEGHPVFIGGNTLDIDHVGRKYFHAEIDGTTTPVEPDRTSTVRDSGSLTVKFKGER